MAAVIAHRGARSLAPENTLAAAELAWEIGAHQWETDISLTKDRELILFHDPHLDRCTNAAEIFGSRNAQDRLVYNYTLKELLCLDAGSFYEKTDPFSQISRGNIDTAALSSFTGLKIPTLAQGLDLVKKHSWSVNLELKRHVADDAADIYLPEKTIETVKKSGLRPEQVVISSFNHIWLDHIRKTAPEYSLAALMVSIPPGLRDISKLPFQAYHLNADHTTAQDIEMLKSAGKRVCLYTVNDPDRFSGFSSLGVDAVFTDFPQLFCSPGH